MHQMKELEASTEVAQKLSLFNEKLRSPYQKILTCLFEMYEDQL